MKKIEFLYNPNAGNLKIRGLLDIIIERFQKEGFEFGIHRSMDKGSMAAYIEKNIRDDNTDLILVSGGDGTVNEVVNAMVRKNLSVPFAVLPYGTANDFANLIGMPQDIEDACDVILQMNVNSVDVGKVNDLYFINVCSGGLFTTVSQEINPGLKNRFGKMAYYVKGFEQIQSYKPMNLRFETNEEVIEENVSLFLIFNGRSAGGFERLAKYALIDDGLLELVIIKAVAVHEIVPLFIKVLQGDHLEHPSVHYRQVSSVKVTSLDDSDTISDIDGEPGPNLPLNISNVQRKLNVVTNFK